jgi:hypothetical protein
MTTQVQHKSVLKRQNSSGSNSATSRRVGFGDVTVLVFHSVLGDHPSVRDGCPIALGNKLKFRSSISVDRHEQVKQARPQRQRRMARLSAATRDTYLLNEGYSLAEIDRVAASIQLIQRQRLETANSNVSSGSWCRIGRRKESTFKVPHKLAGLAA